MKRIINRKKYDTETAKMIACDRVDWDKFGVFSTSGVGTDYALFQKTNGEYFSCTAFKRLAWDEVKFSIEPLTLERAKDFVEEHNNNRYEEIFGEVEE